MIGVGAEGLMSEETGLFGVFIVEGQRKRTGILQFSIHRILSILECNFFRTSSFCITVLHAKAASLSPV